MYPREGTARVKAHKSVIAAILAAASMFATTTVAQPTLKLERSWSLGDDEEDVLFGVIADVARGKDGKTYVLDQQLGVVHVVSERGVVLQTFGGIGEGPGEFSNPRRLAVFDDGRVVVLQPSPPRMSVFDGGGVYRGELEVHERKNASAAVLGLAPIEDGVLLHELVTGQSDAGMVQRQTITVYPNASSQAVREICGAERKFGPARIVIRERETVPFEWVANRERICISKGWSFDVSIVTPGGTAIATLTGRVQKRPRASDQREAVESYLRRGGGTTGAELDIEDFDRDVQWLGMAEDGAVWLLSSEGARAGGEGVLGQFDVYEPDGVHLGKFTLAGRGQPSRDRFVVSGGCLYVLTDFASAFASWRVGRTPGESTIDVDSSDAEQMGVLCYRLPNLADLKTGSNPIKTQH
jgi:hypothetical protein